MRLARSKLLIKERLLSRVSYVQSGCWEYQGKRTLQGYGKMKWSEFNEQLAHRISFIIFRSNGLSIKDFCICHTCDNPCCVNPEHLFLGTHDTNNKDRAKKGRTVTPNMNLTHCKRGHEFNIENTHIRLNGTRLCKKCANEMTRLGYHRRKGNLNEQPNF